MRFAQFIYDGVEPVEMAIHGVLSMARRHQPAFPGGFSTPIQRSCDA